MGGCCSSSPGLSLPFPLLCFLPIHRAAQAPPLLSSSCPTAKRSSRQSCSPHPLLASPRAARSGPALGAAGQARGEAGGRRGQPATGPEGEAGDRPARQAARPASRGAGPARRSTASRRPGRRGRYQRRAGAPMRWRVQAARGPTCCGGSGTAPAGSPFSRRRIGSLNTYPVTYPIFCFLFFFGYSLDTYRWRIHGVSVSDTYPTRIRVPLHVSG